MGILEPLVEFIVGISKLVGALSVALWEAVVATKVLWIVNALLLVLNLLQRRRGFLRRGGHASRAGRSAVSSR